MNKKIIGVEILSRISFTEEIDSQKAREILEDIENHISEYVSKKYNSFVTGKGSFISENQTN